MLERWRLWIGVLATLVSAALGLWILNPWERPPAPRLAPPETASEVDDWEARKTDDEHHFLPGLPLGDGVTIGAPAILANLAVFPVYSSEQHDVGQIVPIGTAVGGKRAEVREVASWSYGAEVNELIIENRDDARLMVLGGTVLRGGLQDRLISSDMVLGPREIAHVKVYCAERSRWNAFRDGVNTNNRFEPLPFLAGTKIWVAGHFEDNQSRVWARVADVNHRHQMSTMTGTLLATLANPTFAAERDALTREILVYLQQWDDVVGLAYAVDGKVRSLRMFANQQLFDGFRVTLSKTMANEALVARAGQPAEPPAEGRTDESETTAQEQVRQLVWDLRDNGELAGDTRLTAGNVTHRFKARRGYSSTTYWLPPTDTKGSGHQVALAAVPLTTVVVARL
ncbi:MAG: hypothetical protein JRI68_08790 [Deltaproteobacteria bacterium]|nr:hypothetical protein [Deltaproteobacteria bacterium]